MGRPKEHDEKTARALLDAGEEIVEADGVAALTVRRVADQVGTSTRAVYSVFGSRDGLLVALAARSLDQLGAAVRALPETDDPAADLVDVGVSVFRAFVVAHPSMFRIGFREAPPELDAQFGESRREVGVSLIARVDRLHRADLLGGRSVEEAVTAFEAFCEGLAEVELRGRPAREDRRTAVRRFPVGQEEERWRDALCALVEGWRSLPVHKTEPGARRSGQTPNSRPRRSGPRRRN